MKTPDNLWKSPVIQNRLLAEAGFDGDNCGTSDRELYWCLVPMADSGRGKIVLKNYENNDIMTSDPHEMQVHFAGVVMDMLQREAHFDGLWLVGFTHPPTKYEVLTESGNCWGRLICIWHDELGDPQYTVESDLPFATQLEHGERYYVGLATQAHEQWKPLYGSKAMKKDMDLKDNQVRAEALEALR